MRMKVSILVAFVAVISLSGCALTTDRIQLQYTPQSSVTPISKAQNVAVNVQVTDQRQDKSKVSAKKNGFGQEKAPIVAAEEVAVTLRKAIEQELQARGFQPGSEAAPVRVDASLTRFYNDYKVSLSGVSNEAIADFSMSITVRSKAGESRYTRQLTAQGIEPKVMNMAGDNAKLALERALANGMKLLFDDPAFLAALLPPSAPGAVSKTDASPTSKPAPKPNSKRSSKSATK